MHAAPGFLKPFHVAEVNGVTFRVANDGFRSVFSGALVGWKVRSEPLVGSARVATMTPYVESTGPRDPGDGFRWIDYRRQLGMGVIIIPPAGWKPEDKTWDLSHATTGEIEAIATSDFEQVKQHVAGDGSGFVLVEPAEGWKNTGASAKGSAVQEPSTESLLLAAGVAVGVAVFIYWLWDYR